eukprot:m.44106 g.44106  ORF g.44106 m.44106 type:complete len:67 (-) comp10818_c0_seq3:1469-1669(-)
MTRQWATSNTSATHCDTGDAGLATRGGESLGNRTPPVLLALVLVESVVVRDGLVPRLNPRVDGCWS